MAKSKKTKVVDTAVPPVGDYKPRLYLDLQDQDVKKLKGLKVGEEGVFRVTGKIVGLSQRDRQEEGKTIKTGSIDLEGFEVEIMGPDDNEFTDLVDDGPDDEAKE